MQVENLEGSELEADVSFQMKRSTLKTVAVATAMIVSVGIFAVGIFALSTNGFSRSCSNLGALQGKSAVDLDAAVRTTSQKLIQARAAANRILPYTTMFNNELYWNLGIKS